MKILLVHAHPEPKSFCTALYAAAVDELARQGHEIEVSDLYAMGFNPVASAADFAAPANPDYCVYALEQRHAVENQTIAPEIAGELDKLLWSDLLILSFPVYWCSTPAILKGWFDRVLVSGTVYGGKRFYDRGGLAGKSVLVCMTLGGQEHMFERDGIHGHWHDMFKHLFQGTLAYTGMKVLAPFIGWHVPYLSDPTRRQMLESWRSHLQSVRTLPALEFPSLDDFDERLRPRRSDRNSRADDAPMAGRLT